MHHRQYDPKENEALLIARVDELRSGLRGINPAVLAGRSGAEFLPEGSLGGILRLPFWNRVLTIHYPEFEVVYEDERSQPNAAVIALLMYFLTITDGSPQSEEWVSFSDLADGRFYNTAFQGYTGKRLVSQFADRLSQFRQAAINSGGVEVLFGDAAFSFRLFPKVALLVVAWQGDEDFPSSYQILFDASINRHLPTDACAIAGSMLTHKIISESRRANQPTSSSE